MSDVTLWLVTSALMLIGLLGIVVPGLPGIALVFAGVLFFGWVTGFAAISPATVALMGLAALLGWLAEYAGGVMGVRAGGGGKAAMLGLIAGALIGFVTSGPPGVILGGLIGAFIGAWYVNQKPNQAAKIAFFSLLGLIGGKAVQFLLALVIIITFGLAVIF